MKTPTRSMVFRLGCAALLALTGVNTQISTAAPNDPFKEIAGTWRAMGFLISGPHLYDFYPCGQVTVRPTAKRSVSASIDCSGKSADVGSFSFRLGYDAESKAYVVTVKSEVGFSVEDFPVSYSADQGWLGQGNKLIDGETVSVTATVGRIEGRRWHGWRILVVPTVVSARPNDASAYPHFFMDLTRGKGLPGH